MKIFLDIGSHIGQTLQEVTKEKYAFDKIYCFEPSLLCIESLEKIASNDSRITICKFGLSNKNQDAELFLPGSQGGTIFEGGIGDLGEESNSSNKSNEVLNLAFFVLTILSLSYTDYAVYEKDHKECYINYLWSLIGTYAFIASSFIYMICRLGVRMGNESVLQQNMGFAIIVFILSVVNLYVFMGIVWTVDSRHSLMFYPEFREWSIHLGHGVKHITFYRIAECLVKIHSVI